MCEFPWIGVNKWQPRSSAELGSSKATQSWPFLAEGWGEGSVCYWNSSPWSPCRQSNWKRHEVQDRVTFIFCMTKAIQSTPCKISAHLQTSWEGDINCGHQGLAGKRIISNGSLWPQVWQPPICSCTVPLPQWQEQQGHWLKRWHLCPCIWEFLGGNKEKVRSK